MRVGIDASPLGSGRGGDETLMRGLLAGLCARAVDTDRLVLLGGEGVVATTPSDPRVARIVLPARPGALRYLHTLPRVLRRLGDRLDVVLSITHAPVRSSVPTALLVTDLSFLHHPEYYPWSVRVRLREVVARQVRRAGVVLTISEFCRGQILDAYDVDEDRVFVVPCAVEPDGRAALDELVGAREWIRRAGVVDKFLLSLGNLHARKNTVRVIEAFGNARRAGRLLDHQMVIAGARWWNDAPEATAAATLDPDAVVFLGSVTEPVRQALLADATALVYPSLFEGFGLPPLEAMAAGTPAVVSDRGALPETCGDAALFVDPLDVGAIERGLVRIADDAELRAVLIARGQAQAASFSIARCGDAAWRALRTVAPGAMR